MGKNSDISSISNSIGTTILHEILVEHTNKPESLDHLTNEFIEYRGQSIKKINKKNLNEKDKNVIRLKVIRKIKNRLKLKYADVKVSPREIIKKVDEGLFYFCEIPLHK